MSTTSTSDHVVCYTADINFLMPSIFSAKSLRGFVAKAQIDIYIFLFHDTSEHQSALDKLIPKLAEDRIFLVITSPSLLENVDTTIFDKGHIPVAAVGRFFLDELLPPQYQHIIYLDGDTWINSDPSKLLFTHIPYPKVALCNDYAAFEGAIWRNKFRHYWSGIKQGNGHNYFNSGVFAASRSAWRVIARQAYEYLLQHPKLCIYHDQSALNAIVNDKRLHLSLRWNFQSTFKYLHLDQEIQPVISHFTRRPKAWQGPVFPWIEQYWLIENIKKEFADFDLPLQSMALQRAHKVSKQKEMKTSLFKNKLIRWLTRQVTGINKYEKLAEI